MPVQYWRVSESESHALGAYADGVPLSAAHSVVLPALCLGRIPHEGRLETLPTEYPGTYVVLRISTVAWIVRARGMLARGLIVDQGPVQDGEVWTEVFNLSNQQIIIRKGEVISRLVAL